MDESVTFKQADLLHGDILLVQRVLSEVIVCCNVIASVLTILLQSDNAMVGLQPVLLTVLRLQVCID